MPTEDSMTRLILFVLFIISGIEAEAAPAVTLQPQIVTGAVVPWQQPHDVRFPQTIGVGVLVKPLADKPYLMRFVFGGGIIATQQQTVLPLAQAGFLGGGFLVPRRVTLLGGLMANVVITPKGPTVLPTVLLAPAVVLHKRLVLAVPIGANEVGAVFSLQLVINAKTFQ